MSAKSRNIGKEFEDKIEESFAAYQAANVAYLEFMPVPTRACMIAGKMVRVGAGNAPFDVYGFLPRQLHKQDEFGVLSLSHPVAQMVGAELKATGKPETSISLVRPKQDGSGIEAHQLDALALLARMGGISRIVWDNGGQIGIIRSDVILAAHAIFMASIASEDRGNGKGKPGCRSIKWSQFEPINPTANVGGQIIIDWLQPDSEVTRRVA